MEIILAKHAGFCEGVERAYKIALDAVKRTKPVFILGDLVHNKDVVAEFKKLGIKRVKSLKGLPPHSTLIITAHGAAPETIYKAEEMKLRIIDTTCPWVKKAQRLARDLARSDRQVVIVGDKGHPEVVGLLGWAGRGAKVVECKSDLKGLRFKGRVGVLAQTTQSKENFDSVVGELRKKAQDVEVYNTICEATSSRQCSAADLAKRVELVLVIGDFKSANTKRLTELCRKVGVPTRQIQNDRELKLKWFKGKKRIGITAGASTPDWIIRRVLEKIRKYDEKN